MSSNEAEDNTGGESGDISPNTNKTSKVSRRKFLGAGAAAGLALAGAGYYSITQGGQESGVVPGSGIASPSNQRHTIIATPKNPQNYLSEDYLHFIRFLESISDQVAGKTIRVAVEAEVAPRALWRNKIDFESSTGLELLLEFDIYRNNLAKSLLAVSTQSPTFDVLNIDVSQVGRFESHLIPIEELMERYPELTYPNLKLDDFVTPVWSLTSKYPPDLIYPPWEKSFNGTPVQMPQETPLMIRFYRKDLYSEEGRELASTWDEYLDDLEHFHAPSRARWGTVLMAARFPSIVMEWHNWLYSFGGKLWDISSDGTINSDVNSDVAVEALEHYVAVNRYAEPNSSFYGWGPAAEALAHGRAAMGINLTEFASLMDTPGESFIVRQMGFAKNPRGEAGSSHHYTGAGLGVPKYSKNPEAAWLFIQWATVESMQVHTAIDPRALAVPTRNAVFEHPKVRDVISEGTIRHFDPVKDAIDKGEVNVKPGFPNWESIEGTFMNELHKAVLKEISPKQALDAVRKKSDELGPFSF